MSRGRAARVREIRRPSGRPHPRRVMRLQWPTRHHDVMTYTSDLGPVELVVLSFPGARIDRSVTSALAEVVDRGYVTVLDLIYLAMDEKGNLGQVEVDESLTDIGLDGLTVDSRGLVSDEDLDVVRAAMQPGTSAVVIAYEETWARKLAGTVRGAGGEVALHVQIPRDAVTAALSAATR